MSAVNDWPVIFSDKCLHEVDASNLIIVTLKYFFLPVISVVSQSFSYSCKVLKKQLLQSI